ncbi:MAG: hypothetical protein ACLQVD_21085 [Capsulimonadaceae bacterium]
MYREATWTTNVQLSRPSRQPQRGDLRSPSDDWHIGGSDREDPSWTLAEISRLTGVSERAIRLYIARGAIDRADVGGMFGPSHRSRLLTLRQIERSRRFQAGIATLAAATLILSTVVSVVRTSPVPFAMPAAPHWTHTAAAAPTATGHKPASDPVEFIVDRWRTYANNLKASADAADN